MNSNDRRRFKLNISRSLLLLLTNIIVVVIGSLYTDQEEDAATTVTVKIVASYETLA
jgi:hypothetical protein